MEADHGNDADDTTERQQHQEPSIKARSPPPIVLTSQENLIQLQSQLKGLLKGNFEFRSVRKGARIVTKEMADFSNLPHLTFYPKPQKPIKAVIQHRPLSTPAEDISDGTVNLGFDGISINYHSSITCRRNNHSKHSLFPNNLT
jgi:hypothetical protein